jgi:hypothetical protein
MDGLGRAKDYPLSDGDIKKILGSDTQIITYPMLKGFKNIDQCFDRKGRCILLFLTTSPTEGHWVCMLRRPNSIEYFDPYGESPEEMKEQLPQSLLSQLDESRPYLSNLMRASGLPVYYNTHSFQKDRANINTCGRHCVVRCLYAPYSVERYLKTIQKTGLSPDDFVIGKTYDILKK